MNNKNPIHKSRKVSHFSRYLMDFNPDSKLAKNMNILKAISGLGRSKGRDKAVDQTKTVQEIAFKLADELASKDREIAELKAKLSLVRFVLDMNPLPAEFINEFAQESNASSSGTTEANTNND